MENDISFFGRVWQDMNRLIGGAVGNNMPNTHEDVTRVKSALNRLGRFRENTPHGYITSPLDKAIKGFQRDHGLKIDGILKPGGETETLLRSVLQRLSSDDGNTMPTVRPDGVKRESLPPPTRKIPGTNIPDHGIPEQGFSGGRRLPNDDGLWERNKHMDPDLEIQPPVRVDPYMPIIDPERFSLMRRTTRI